MRKSSVVSGSGCGASVFEFEQHKDSVAVAVGNVVEAWWMRERIPQSIVETSYLHIRHSRALLALSPEAKP